MRWGVAAAVWLSVCGAVSGCGGAGSESRADADTVLPAAVTELPMPEVPESLQTPEERAAYVAAHFWDAMDFRNHALSLDTAFVEQNFVNFAAVLPIASPEAAQSAVDTLIARASIDASAVDFLASTAATYLDHPNSPMRSEELYILFLRSLNNGALVPEATRVRAGEKLEVAMKNRPGMRAADFGVVTRRGGTSTLLHKVQPDTTLVVFYDPDCEHCKELTGRLAQSEVPYRVLAVDVAGDRQRWEASRAELPARWEVAFATSDIEDGDLYAFPALPSFYLLAPDGTVLLKDFTPRF